MNLTEALEQYRAMLDEQAFLEADKARGWADAYRRFADGRPWSQVEAGIKADLTSTTTECIRVDAEVRKARATLDVAMLMAQLQGARRVDLPD